MRSTHFSIAATFALLGTASAGHAAWVNLVNDTATRIPTTGGLNNPAITINDPEEMDYAWGDVDKDGDIDMVVVRKEPLSFPGGFRGIMWMNEGIAEGHAVNGVLVDRTTSYAATSINVPQSELDAAAAMSPPQSNVTQGLLDLCNNRDVVLIDVNNDGWLDFVTTTTVGDVKTNGTAYMLPRFLSHPRVYINQGKVKGEWQGFVYDYSLFPQIFSKSGVAVNGRFCSLGAGDINGDGYADLFMSDYDTGEVGPAEAANHDTDNRLFMNAGASNPGAFTDVTVASIGANFPYPNGVGTKPLYYSTFGSGSDILDLDGDGVKDLLRLTTLVQPQHISAMKNNGSGVFAGADYKIQYAAAPYFVSAGDLNNDGKSDLVISDDSPDKYLLWTGVTSGQATYQTKSFTFGAGLSENEFGGQSLIVDLNNDGWNDALIADFDVDTFGCSRRLHIYHNLGNGPSITLKEESPVIIPNQTGSIYVAAFDINGDNWKDVIIARCSGTSVWMNQPQVGISFSYPDGLPSQLSPDTPTTINVQVAATNGGALDASSPSISYSINGAGTVSASMVSLGGDLYEATIPPTACHSSVRFYFGAQLNAAIIPLFDPPLAARFYEAISADSLSVQVADDFEGGPNGWTVTNDGSLTGGAWEVAAPNGTWNEGVQAAPGSNHTNGGSNAFVTQNGAANGALSAADVDGGPTYLVSPTIDLDGTNARITFAYWFYSSTTEDTLGLWVSNNNGASWVSVKNFAGPYLGQVNQYMPEDNAWKTYSFNVGDHVAPTGQVRVRFSANDLSPGAVVEAGIDDFTVERAECDFTVPCAADLTANGEVDVDDLLQLINTWGRCRSCPEDLTGNGQVDVDDLLALINAWGPCGK